MESEPRGLRKYVHWTEAETAMLRKCMAEDPQKSWKDIAKLVGKSVRACNAKAAALQLLRRRYSKKTRVGGKAALQAAKARMRPCEAEAAVYKPIGDGWLERATARLAPHDKVVARALAGLPPRALPDRYFGSRGEDF